MFARFLIRRYLNKVRRGSLTVCLPDGQVLRAEGSEPGPYARVELNAYGWLYRAALRGDLAIAEAFMDGQWSSDDLPELMRLGLANTELLRPNRLLTPLVALLGRVAHRGNANTLKGSKRNIAFHYDLGNAFYSAWLDPSMTYSSALFEDEGMDMGAAQSAKYHRLAQSLNLQPGDRVLEIGCGWGGFAEIAARDYGVHVVGLTLSEEQAAFATERMAAKGLSDQVEIRLQDYRHVEGQFDKIASIEMFEAVGEEYWPTYFQVLRDRLAPHGRAALQIITIDDNVFRKYRRRIDFIRRYIFPGGMLPSEEALSRAVQDKGLVLADSHFFGLSYASTLQQWRERFTAAWPSIADMGFDQRFQRMWLFYLSYCEGGFRSGRINVGQFTLTKGET